jgi:hypothetical protein
MMWLHSGCLSRRLGQVSPSGSRRPAAFGTTRDAVNRLRLTRDQKVGLPAEVQPRASTVHGQGKP